MAKNKFIYLDNASTTPVSPDVLEAMLPYFNEQFGNPSSVCNLGQQAARAVDKARRTAASSIGARTGEIYFTSGGSESDNWAIRKIAEAYRNEGKHIITTKIEHHAVLNTLSYLETQGYDVTYLDVDSDGLVDPEDVRKAIRPDTILISVMFANNEIGTIEPIAQIGRIAYDYDILFHTDAVQAYGHIPIDVNECHIDLMSTSAHKLNGPKGVGFLFVRDGTTLLPLIYGGGQEHGMRSGTENVAGIVGFGKAIEDAIDNMGAYRAKEEAIRDYIINTILSEVPRSHLNGSRVKRLPNNINISFRGVQSESLLTLLDDEGICCSVGSACSSGSLEASHVLTAIGLSDEMAHSTIRMTLSKDTTKSDAFYVTGTVARLVRRLRESSPSYIS